MKKIMKYLEDEFHKKLYITENGCNLINRVQEMITRERIVIKNERNIMVPGCQLQLVDDETINAFSTKIDGEYCIFVNKGIIEEQKNYLERLDWSFISETKQRTEYINKMIEYGFYFIVFHEYAHILCGHIDAGLSNSADKKAQECEADMFSMDYLVKYIEAFHSMENLTIELEKMFLSVYFLFENMQKQNYLECYNDRLIQNYYDEDRILQRDHPLNAQRVLYLYEMLNIVVVTDKIQMLPLKDNIIDKLRIIKRLTNKDISTRKGEYLTVHESVQKIKESIKEIRNKIPRLNSK